MKIYLALAAAAAVPGVAVAQVHDHGSHEAHAEPGQQEPAHPDGTDHSAHENQAEADPHAGHDMSAGATGNAAEPHSGHDMHAAGPTAPADPHAGHGAALSGATDSPPPPVAGPPPEAFIGPEFAADPIFGAEAMMHARRTELGPMHGGAKAYRVMIDRLEAQDGDGADVFLLDGQAWYGGDIDKLWLKVEGEGAFGSIFEEAEVQALWSHAIGPWFDLQTGVRYDFGHGKDRGNLVAGVQGLAPYWIELDAAVFLSQDGDLTAAVEAEHDMRITQKLILQPQAEVSFAAQDIPEEALGAGVTAVAAGLRLRYEITPLFAPYVGVVYGALLGGTAQRARALGEDSSQLSVAVGIRAWF